MSDARGGHPAKDEASVAKHFENPMQLSRMILLAALTLAAAIPMRAQSTAPPGSTPAESAPKDSGTSQEPKQAAADQKAEQKTEQKAEQGAEPAAPTSPEEVRQAEIADDTKKLFRLSAELRAEVAKTYKETLSLAVLKKAEEIEKLAKSLKTLMDREATAAKREDH